MDVFIAESSYAKDFYDEALDGIAVRNLLRAMHVENELRMVLDKKHFQKAIKEAVEREFNVFHISCHGGDAGIALSDLTQLSWDDFAEMFQSVRRAPEVLVVSSCCGARNDISRAFKERTKRPQIIFGSTESLSYGQYCAAWAILYHRLNCDGVTRETAQTALRHITAVVHDSFIYRRWYDQKKQYVSFPFKGVRYEVKQI